MKKQLTIINFGIILALLLISLVSSVTDHYQEVILYPENEHITRRVVSVFWLGFDFDSGFLGSGAVNDEITSDELLEVEIDYSIYIQRWNSANYNYAVQNCTLTINYFENKANESYIFYERTITKDDADILGDKYFVRLNQKDGLSAFMDCYFIDEDSRILDTPTELSIKLPTYECKTCQYYEWSVQQRDIGKARTIGENSVSVWNYIKKVIDLNFEIILALFWLILILMAIGGFGLVFFGIYWLFLYLRKISREIR